MVIQIHSNNTKLTHSGIFTYLCICVITVTEKEAIGVRSGRNGEGIREGNTGGVEKRKVKVEEVM